MYLLQSITAKGGKNRKHPENWNVWHFLTGFLFPLAQKQRPVHGKRTNKIQFLFLSRLFHLLFFWEKLQNIYRLVSNVPKHNWNKKKRMVPTYGSVKNQTELPSLPSIFPSLTFFASFSSFLFSILPSRFKSLRHGKKFGCLRIHSFCFYIFFSYAGFEMFQFESFMSLSFKAGKQ